MACFHIATEKLQNILTSISKSVKDLQLNTNYHHWVKICLQHNKCSNLRSFTFAFAKESRNTQLPLWWSSREYIQWLCDRVLVFIKWQKGFLCKWILLKTIWPGISWVCSSSLECIGDHGNIRWSEILCKAHSSITLQNCPRQINSVNELDQRQSSVCHSPPVRFGHC